MRFVVFVVFVVCRLFVLLFRSSSFFVRCCFLIGSDIEWHTCERVRKRFVLLCVVLFFICVDAFVVLFLLFV